MGGINKGIIVLVFFLSFVLEKKKLLIEVNLVEGLIWLIWYMYILYGFIFVGVYIRKIGNIFVNK